MPERWNPARAVGSQYGESVRGDRLRSKLEYKCRWQGRVFIPVPARQTSQTCSHCGATDPESRVSRDTFRCTQCQYEADADVNAAENIRRRGMTPARADDLPGRAGGAPTGQLAKEDPEGTATLEPEGRRCALEMQVQRILQSSRRGFPLTAWLVVVLN